MSDVVQCQVDELRIAICVGDREQIGAEIEGLREQMVRIVRVRMDVRLAARLDAADVVQEAIVSAWKRIDEFPEQPVSFRVWLRFLVLQKLTELQRQHLGVQARDARREVSQHRAGHSSSFDLARQLVADATSPSQAAVRRESRLNVQRALERLSERDHEILALRFLERLTNVEVSQLLEISPAAASNRLVRALERLRALLPVTADGHALI